MKKQLSCILLAASLFPALFLSCEGDDPDERNKFTGRYEVEEQSLETYSPRDDYEVQIRKDAGSESLIVISNFYNYDVDVFARIDRHTLFIEDEVHGIFRFNGTGTLSGSVITVDYTVESVLDDSDYFDRLRAEMTRKD